MGRSRYRIYETRGPHFLTCTIALVPTLQPGRVGRRLYRLPTRLTQILCAIGGQAKSFVGCAPRTINGC